MANCEQTDSYGALSIVDSINCNCPPEIRFVDVSLIREPWWRVFGRLAISTLKGGNIEDIEDIGRVPIHRIAHGQITHGDVGWLNLQSPFDLGRFFNGLIAADTRMALMVMMRRRSFKSEELPYKLGALDERLSGMCKLLPDLSARLLLAAYDPDIRGLSSVQEYNILSHAMATFVLLPPDARLDIFGKMVRLSPDSNGNARKLLSSIALSCSDAGVNYKELLQLVGT